MDNFRFQNWPPDLMVQPLHIDKPTVQHHLGCMFNADKIGTTHCGTEVVLVLMLFLNRWSKILEQLVQAVSISCADVWFSFEGWAFTCSHWEEGRDFTWANGPFLFQVSQDMVYIYIFYLLRQINHINNCLVLHGDSLTTLHRGPCHVLTYHAQN